MKKYLGMYKRYFDLKNKETVNQLAKELRNSVSSISLDLNINDHPAFIVYCDEILNELHEIQAINQKVWLLAKEMPTVAFTQFLRQAMIEEIHQTNEMENIQSTRKEIQDEWIVIQNGKKSKRFDGMIRKYQLLLNNEKIPLGSCQDIRTLYDSFVLDEVMKEDPKQAPDGLYFRKDPVSVVRKSETIHEGVFPENKLNDTMERALAFLNNKDFDPLIRIAAYHYLFGYIHPFYNGNGRMTRFISSYYLYLEKINILVSLRLSYVIKSHQALYYKMFKETNDHRNYGDLTCFVIRFLEFIREAGEQVFSFLKEKKEILDHYQKMIQEMPYDDPVKEILFILVQVSVCEGESLSVSSLQNIIKTSYYKLRKNLALTDRYLIQSRKGNSMVYRANLQKLDGTPEE